VIHRFEGPNKTVSIRMHIISGLNHFLAFLENLSRSCSFVFQYLISNIVFQGVNRAIRLRISRLWIISRSIKQDPSLFRR
jgi:hypothetical protein